MIELRKTEAFAQWLDDLRDIRARARVQARIERLALGNRGVRSPSVKGSVNFGSIQIALRLARGL